MIALTPELVREFTPRIRGYARIWRGRLPVALDEGDLFSVGCIGLWQASQTYDARWHVLFRTYAAHRIKGAMLDEIRKVSWGPRLALHRQHLMHLAEADWELLEGHTADPCAKDALAELLVQEATDERHAVLQALLNRLPRVQRQVVAWYDQQCWSMKRIGKALGVTESRAAQIHTAALVALRRAGHACAIGVGPFVEGTSDDRR